MYIHVSSNVMENSQQSSLSITSLGSQGPLQKIAYAFTTFSFYDPKFCGTFSVFFAVCLLGMSFRSIFGLFFLSICLTHCLSTVLMIFLILIVTIIVLFLEVQFCFFSEFSCPCLVTSMLACQNDSILSE